MNSFNYLVIENIDTLSFPKEIKETVSKINWEEQEWIAIGLPKQNCKYCISNNVLYFEEDENKDSNLKKIEFTGEIFFCTTIINPEKGEDNYVVSFDGILFKGFLSEARLKDFSVQTFEEYQKGFQEYEKTQKEKEKILNSKWYKFLYLPYYKVVTQIFFFLSFIINRLTFILIKVFDFLTPLRFI
jgi:hypothetical protein